MSIPAVPPDVGLAGAVGAAAHGRWAQPRGVLLVRAALGVLGTGAVAHL